MSAAPCPLCIAQLSMSEQYASYMETTLQLATSQGVVLPPRSSAAKNVLSNLQASLTLMLPDDDVGAILGRKGQNLVDIQQVRWASKLGWARASGAAAACWGTSC